MVLWIHKVWKLLMVIESVLVSHIVKVPRLLDVYMCLGTIILWASFLKWDPSPLHNVDHEPNESDLIELKFNKLIIESSFELVFEFVRYIVNIIVCLVYYQH